MNKVFQRNVNKGDGDCVRAALSTLFGIQYEDCEPLAPDEHQAYNMLLFYRKMGYYEFSFYRTNIQSEERGFPSLAEVLEFDGGINGLFYASVKSRTFDEGTHAVLIDKSGTVVHDPNPNQKCLGLGIEEVIDVVVTGNWHISTEGKLIRE